MRRRQIIQSVALLAAGQLASRAFRAEAEMPAAGAAPQPFDFAWLKGQARWLAGSAYGPPRATVPQPLVNLGYDQYQSLRFRPDHALWAELPSAFRLQFFHVGRGFTTPVRLFEVEGGNAREIVYEPAMFNFSESGIDPQLMVGQQGFAGFRVQNVTNWQADIAAFLGAAYFRAVGSDTRQYGLSTRALAVDTALPRPEEFPRFTAFWFERPAPDAGTLTLYALMDSPSVTGALRIVIAPGGTQVMDVDAAFYPRKAIERLGVSPLTSMFYYAKNDRRGALDWRPEIHDSDGLSLWTGAGEWIWRPLTNPAQLHFNSYLDDNPRGFGLLQRDRNFDHYQDDGVYYDRRPSLWVEPKLGPAGNGWGKGAVQLVEIPTVDETFDNIVAFWNPAEKPRAGEELLFSYRLYWGTKVPYASTLAQVIATRTGIGGTIGQRRTVFAWHFAVDFAGGELGALAKDAPVEAVVTASSGEIHYTTAHYLAEFNGYRALFDVQPVEGSEKPIDLRLYLRIQGHPLTETWIYQYTPPPLRERKQLLQ
jgi:glucans biosynthesis protein